MPGMPQLKLPPSNAGPAGADALTKPSLLPYTSSPFVPRSAKNAVSPSGICQKPLLYKPAVMSAPRKADMPGSRYTLQPKRGAGPANSCA